MRYLNAFFVFAALAWLTGCETPPTVAVVQPVGTAPAPLVIPSGQGSLQVYSARQKEPSDPNALLRPWEYSVSQYKFTYALAHTDYRICTADGKDLQYVRNANNLADPTPTVVVLPPGEYRIEADAEKPGAETVKLMIPIVIEAGRTTVLHLAEHWQPEGQPFKADAVRLPDGEIAGWVAIQ